MNFRGELAYCEKLIGAYKDQLSDDALYEIYSFVVEYWLSDAGKVYTDEELEEVEDRQGFEILDIIYGIMDKDGIPINEDYRTDDV